MIDELTNPSASSSAPRGSALKRPLVIDLCCGLGGWTRGFLAEGYDAIGFDIERHQYGDKRYPAQLVLQDITTLHGSQFRHAAVIVASPPCQAYSYRAMPWKRAKALPPPDNTLFETCFRIAREAGVPIVVENVKGAQPWVGRAKAHFGSFYLWGDIESVGDRITVGRFGQTLRPVRAQKFNPDGTAHGQGSWFKIADSQNRGGRKVPGMNFHEFEKTGLPGRSFQSAAVDHTKGGGDWNRYDQEGRDLRPEGLKGLDGKSWIRNRSADPRKSHATNSPSRKAASAMIAEIPFDLAQWIARCFLPVSSQCRSPVLSECSLKGARAYQG